MFGYIRPFKPELKMKEFTAYKSVYCGLCGQLGKRFGPLARLSLSYDFTFLCMLRYAVTDEEPGVCTHRCYVNPLRRMPMCAGGESLVFCADIAVLLIYYKLLDNLHDKGPFSKLGAAVLWPWVAHARRRAAKAQPEVDALVAHSMERQRALEQQGCDSVDAACAPTADAMSAIFAMLSPEARQKRVLERLGYLIGRFVYLCDALDDLERDLAQKGYNPFVQRFAPNPGDAGTLAQARQAAQGSLYMTVGEIGRTAELLELARFQPVLQNILHLGLRAVVDEIQSKKEKNK